ncbi:MAG: type II toxin-antitoxin system PemK/MazF family toxin [Erysipelotrichaceae bacterium]|nr:type II toxin-antitoxin system PemK/MazF family toxin [Erysipelotrichaceae bacterium]
MFHQGDIIWLDFDPQTGHEQKGRRPALIVWNDTMLKKIPGMALVCAVSTTDNGFPLHIKLDDTSKNTKGYILCEQSRVVDLNARNAKLKDKVSEKVLNEVKEILIAEIE